MFLYSKVCTTTSASRIPLFRRSFAAAASKKNKGKGSGKDVDAAAMGKQHDASMKLCLKILNTYPDENNGNGLTPEEQEEYHEAMKEYNKRFRERYLKQEAARAIRLQLMHEAIEALPEEEKAFARTPDTSLPPLSRKVLVDTPPNPNNNRGKK